MICHAKWQMQVQMSGAGTKCRTVGVLSTAPERHGDAAWDGTEIEVRLGGGRLVIRRRPNSAAALYWAGLIQPAGREDLGDGG